MYMNGLGFVKEDVVIVEHTRVVAGARSAPPATPLIRLRGLAKHYPVGAGTFTALSEVDLDVAPGEFLSIVGRSGSGKSTLINLLTGIDRPSAGEIWVAGTAVHTLDEEALAVWRGATVGVVFQFFQLLPTLTVIENVALPMDFCNSVPPTARRERALELLARVGVADQADKLPSDLSGGQQQRAAIARALANDPALIVADEPTGNLDSTTTDAVMALFAGLARDGKTVVMVTHERGLDSFFTRRVELADGRVVRVAAAGSGGRR